jgi:exosortase A
MHMHNDCVTVRVAIRRFRGGTRRGWPVALKERTPSPRRRAYTAGLDTNPRRPVLAMIAPSSLPQRPAAHRPHPRWGPALAVFVLGLATIVWCFIGTWRSMERIWNGSDTYGHGYVVPLTALWLAWRMRDSLAAIRPAPGGMGAVVLALCAIAWLVGEIAGVNSISQAAVVAMIAGWALTVFGHEVTRRLLFPLAFLFFMVPLGEGLEPLLMDWTADVTVAWLRFVGLPVYREGLHFTLPTGRWSVVEACSGLRYVIAALLLSLLFAHLNYRSRRRRIAFVAAAVAIALVANWVRAWMIVLIGHLSDMRLGVGEDHVWYGWAFFGLVMMAVFLLGNRWRDIGDDRDRPVPYPASAPPAADARWSVREMSGALAVLLVLALVQPLPDLLARTTPRVDYAAGIADEMAAGRRERLSLEPAFRAALSEARGAVGAGGSVEFYSAYYADQRARAELIAFGNAVVRSDDRIWSVVRSGTIELRDADDLPFPAIEYRVRAGAKQALVWHWYTVAGHSTASPYRVKLATLKAIALRHGDHSSVNVVFAPLDGDEEAARHQMAPVAARLASAASRATSP